MGFRWTSLFLILKELVHPIKQSIPLSIGIGFPYLIHFKNMAGLFSKFSLSQHFLLGMDDRNDDNESERIH